MNKKSVGGKLTLEYYRSFMEESPIATIDVLFFNTEKTKTLLGLRTNEPYSGMWYSFGGRLYKNEEFVDAALRVTKKETGIVLSSSEITFAGAINEIHPNSIFEGINYHAVNVYFACVIDEHVLALDPQHSEARWADVGDSTLHPYVREKIEGAIRAL